jgi:hypothetical protein
VAEGTQRSKWHLLLFVASLRNNHCNFHIPAVFKAKLLVSSTSHERHCLLSCNDCLETMPQVTANTIHINQLVNSTFRLSNCSASSALNCLSIAHLSYVVALLSHVLPIAKLLVSSTFELSYSSGLQR